MPSTPAVPATTPSFNAVHACLIPDGPHRGEVLIWDGNLGAVRDFQPYCIVNPYWPAPNPFSSAPSAFRFHNGLLDLRINGVPGTSRGELFCGGKTWLPNGRLFVTGGTLSYPPALPATGPFVGTKDCWQFDPLSTTAAFPFGQWFLMSQPLAANRWYPTVILDGKRVTAGSDYRVLIVGGIAPTSSNPANHLLDTYESAMVRLTTPIPIIGSFEQRPSTNNWGTPGTPRLFGGAITFSLGGLRPFFGEMNAYPRIHTLSTGEFFLSGEPTTSSAWSHAVMMSTTPLDPLASPPITPYDRTRGQVAQGFPPVIEEGVTLMLPNVNGVNDDMIRIGGAIDFGNGVYPNSIVETCNAVTPGTWANGPGQLHQLNHPRAKPNVTILPDASLLAVGGIETWTLDANGDPINPTYCLTPERLVGVQWTDMAPMAGPRDYHSCSVLLPDGRVFTCGGEHRAVDYQIYIPPYLFGPDTRAVLASVFDSTGALIPQTGSPALAYGTVDNKVTWSNVLPKGIGIKQIVLMRPAALTHHDDGGQRYFELPSKANGPQSRFFDAPKLGPNGHPEVPPGWWMLFAVNNVGVPSQAYWINLQ